MNNSILSLFQLLERLGPEAEGRSMDLPVEKDQVMLRRLVTGQVTEAERKEMCDQLRARPGWLQWVAEEVKSQRTSGG